MRFIMLAFFTKQLLLAPLEVPYESLVFWGGHFPRVILRNTTSEQSSIHHRVGTNLALYHTQHGMSTQLCIIPHQVAPVISLKLRGVSYTTESMF